MSKSYAHDLLDEWKQIGLELDSISSSKKIGNFSEQEALALHKREFELCMIESKLDRKIRESLEELQTDVKNRFFIKRVITDLEKRNK
jgi:hypothetical protein